jgi:hypothetical protein
MSEPGVQITIGSLDGTSIAEVLIYPLSRFGPKEDAELRAQAYDQYGDNILIRMDPVDIPTMTALNQIGKKYDRWYKRLWWWLTRWFR